MRFLFVPAFVLTIAYTSFLDFTPSERNFQHSSRQHQLPDQTYEQAVQESIREHMGKLIDHQTVDLDGQKIIGNSVLLNLYKNVDFQPVWSEAQNRKDLIKILEDSHYEGLNPKDYHIDYLKEYEELTEGDLSIEPDLTARSDIFMTNAILTYAHHLIQGKVHPVQLDPNWNYSYRPLPDSAEFLLLKRLKSQTLEKGIDNIRSDLPMYQRLRYWFAHYDSLKRTGGTIDKIEYPGKPLRLGDSSAMVASIKRQLANYGYSFPTLGHNKFGNELEEVLKEFQRHYGLQDDGIAGKNTFEALNMSIDERLDVLRVNMERCRWINNDLPKEFLLVNIADYQLYIFRNRKIDYHSRVVVGKEHHETPIFTSKIQYVVFNPTWTLPYSIASKEILPHLKRDSHYLQNRNMTLLKGGSEIDPNHVDFSQYSERYFPYTIRQEPGPHNALGRMKFIFPNHFSVYLHDTPSKSYFEQSQRAFSHGCVRVQNPQILAEQLLGNKGFDGAKISDVLKSEKTQTVYLKEPMPVMLMYWTCYESKRDGRMYFYRDIYGRDSKILHELSKSL